MLKKSLTAFLDILGFAHEMTTSFKDGTANTLLCRLRSALSRAHKEFSDEASGLPIEVKTWEVKAFTDNIVLGYPITFADAEGELGALLLSAREYQLAMVNAGFFVRGGIAIGQLYMDSEIVFGDALIEAYKAESTLARDPRVVLANSVMPYLEQHLKFYAKPSESPHNRVLLRDADGQIFLNYLEALFDEDPRLAELEKHKAVVEEKLQKYKNDPPVWSKYAWSAHYHNFICHEHGLEPSRHTIDSGLLRASPTRLLNPADDPESDPAEP